MFYYKKGSSYIASDSEIMNAESISKSEYDRVKAIVDNRPPAGEGYSYRLDSNLEWKFYEVPIVEEELSEEETLAILMGGAV